MVRNAFGAVNVDRPRHSIVDVVCLAIIREMAPRHFMQTLAAALALFAFCALARPASAQPRQGRAQITETKLNAESFRPGDKGELTVTLEIKPGFHAQSRTPSQPNLIKFDVKMDDSPAFTFGEPVFPKGEDHKYGDLETLNVYTGTVTLRIPFEAKPDAPGGETEIKGKLRYQICDDKACFPPESPKFSVKATVISATAAPVAATNPTTTAPSAPPVVISDSSAAQRSALGWFAIAFFAGILFNIVPCVLPVLPIKVLGFAEVAQHDRGKTVMLATVFGAGVVTVFAILAMLILVLKTLTWGQQFANPWFAWGIVVILLLLSLWLFGILNINLPPAAYGFTPRHDTYFGNYLWGMLTAVLSTPCTGPLFPPLMLWAQQQPTSIGVPAFMMVGVGMAFPYVALSAMPEVARKFPRVGPFAELFKQMLGFVLLGFTVFFAAGRFTHPSGQWWAVVPVAVMAALYLMARTVQLSREARAVAISSFVSVLIVTTSVLVANRYSDAGVSWQPYSDTALNAARKEHKIVLIKFTANWCLNCQYVEASVYHDARAIAALREHDVVTLKADLTQDDAAGWPRLRELRPTGGIPLTAIYSPSYDMPVQITDVYTTDTLVKTLDQLDRTNAVAAR